MNLTECLKFAVGLSQNDCPCLDQNYPEDYDRSDSGFFIDDMEEGLPLIFTQSATDCGQGGVWDLLEKARTEAIREFQTDYSILLSQFHRRKYQAYTGMVGDEKNSYAMNNVKAYVTMYLKFKRIQDGRVVIKGGTLTSHTAGTTTITVRTNQDNFSADLPGISKVVAFNAKQRTSFTFDTALEFDMVLADGRPLEVAIIATTDSGYLPRNTQFNCGCAGRRVGWEVYLEGWGATMDDPIELQPNYLNEVLLSKELNRTMGMTVDVAITCKEMDWLCNDLDYVYSPYSRVMAKIIQLYAILKLTNFILSSHKVNRYTLLEREHLYGKRNRIRSMIEQKMTWLALNLPQGASDCFLCGDTSMVKKAIIV